MLVVGTGGMTKTAFADVMGVDRSQPTRWAKQGMPVNPDGSVDAVGASEWVRRNVRDYARVRRSKGTRQAAEGAASQNLERYHASMRMAVSVSCHHMLLVAAQAAVSVGVPLGTTYAMVRDMQTRGGLMRDKTLEMFRIPLGDRALGEALGGFMVNWPALAEHLGEELDLQALEAEAEELVGPNPSIDDDEPEEEVRTAADVKRGRVRGWVRKHQEA